MSNIVMPGYKQTEVGVIPEDWDVCCLSTQLLDGPKNGYSGRSGKDARGTPTLMLSATTSGRMILNNQTIKRLDETLDPRSDVFLRSGDVLVQRSNTVDLVGTTAIFDSPASIYIYPDRMIRLRFKSPHTAHWFWRYANSASGRRYFVAIAAGSTGSMPKISGDNLRNMLLPLPPPAEQEAIAGALRDADAHIVSLEQLIAKKRQLKQGAMQELLTGKRRLPGFSGEWETHRIGDLFSSVRNASNSRSELTSDGDVAYVHYGDIHTHPTAFLDVTYNRTYIDRSKVKSVPRLAVGDLLMADASEDTEAIGKAVEIVSLNGHETVAGLHTMALRASNAVVVNGFKGYIQFLPMMRSALVRLATGVSVYGVTKSGVKEIEITIPKPPEQAAIAAILSDMDAEITAVEEKLTKARQIKQGMIQELLTGRIRLV